MGDRSLPPLPGGPGGASIDSPRYDTQAHSSRLKVLAPVVALRKRMLSRWQRRSYVRARFAAGKRPRHEARRKGSELLQLYGRRRRLGATASRRRMPPQSPRRRPSMPYSMKRQTRSPPQASPRPTSPCGYGRITPQANLSMLLRGGLAQAAKTAGVDLLVSGSLAVDSGYATLSLRGFDSALGREVFAWKGFCAVDDPEPLASEMAEKLEAWSAGRPFARVELKSRPASAEIRVNRHASGRIRACRLCLRSRAIDYIGYGFGFLAPFDEHRPQAWRQKKRRSSSSRGSSREARS